MRGKNMTETRTRNLKPAGAGPKEAPAKAQTKAAGDKPAKKAKSSKKGDAIPQPSANDESRNISIRKIENGYIVSESGYDQRRGYTSRDTYVPGKPVISISHKGAQRKP